MRIFQLSGADGRVELSRSTGPDWAGEPYVGTVKAELGPLLAAAPDLLAACELTQNVVRNILTDSQPDGRTTCGETIRQWSAALNSAIAKAKGGA